MLRASWRICLGLCDRGFFGSGFSASIGRQTTASSDRAGGAWAATVALRFLIVIIHPSPPLRIRMPSRMVAEDSASVRNCQYINSCDNRTQRHPDCVLVSSLPVRFGSLTAVNAVITRDLPQLESDLKSQNINTTNVQPVAAPKIR